MTLPASGTIGLLAIRTEFPGQGLPMNLLNYLKPGAFVTADDYAPNVPGVAPVSLSDFYSAMHQPVAPTMDLVSGFPTYTTPPTFTGTGTVGLTVYVYADTTLLGTTTVDGSGNWSATPSLTDGTVYYSMKAKQGNANVKSPATTNTWNFTYDTYVAPTISLSASTASGSYSGTNPVRSASITATVTNGRNITGASWVKISGDAAVSTGAQDYTSDFYATLNFPQTLGAVYQFECDDDRGTGYRSSDLTVSLTR